MSAIAFFCTADKIVMHSDGIAHQNGQIFTTSYRKAHKINSHTGLLWIGYGLDLAPTIIKLFIQQGHTDIEGMAAAIGDNIKTVFEVKQEPLPDFNTVRWCIMLLGWASGQPKLFSLDSKPPNDPFKARQETVSDGTPGCMAYDQDATEASYCRLLRQKYWPLYKDAEHASTLAFTEMIEGYQQAGKPIGGKIFTEFISPPG